MSLRLKAALIIIGSTLAIIVPIHWFSESVLQKSFQDIENQNGIENLQRIRTAFVNEATGINSKLVDWSAWTDTYQFVKTKSPDYIKVNLNYESIVALKFNWALLFNKKGDLVFGGEYNAFPHKTLPVNAQLLSHFKKESPFLKFTNLDDYKYGFLVIGKEVIAFASRPIITSERTGPPAGTMVFAKRVSTDTQNRLQSDLKISFQMTSIGSSQRLMTYEAAAQDLLSGVTHEVDSDSWFGSTVVDDAYGEPIIKIKNEGTREITQAGNRAFQTIQMALIFSGIAFLLLTLFLLNRWLITRIHEITNYVTHVEKTQNFDLRLNPQSWDEIGQLSLSLNRMAESLGRSQKALQQSEERLKLAFDATSGGVWDWNMLTHEVTYDRKWKEMLGYESYELENSFETFYGLLHPDDKDKVKSEIDDYLNGFTSTYSIRVRMRAKDGSYRWILTEGAVLRDAHRQPIRMVGWHRDITEDIFQQELVEKQRAQLVSSSRLSALGEMSAGVAHEINNPLTIILGIASQMKGRIEKPNLDLEKLKKNCDTIIDTTDRIAKIVRSLRNISRDASQDPKEHIGIQRILMDTLSMCHEKLRNRGIQVDLPDVDESLSVFVRPVEVSQILVNLLNNASDAVKDLSEEHRWVRLSCNIVDQAASITVENGGPAIPEHIRSRLFQPFFTTKEVGSGTGLGLSIAKNFAENNNGTLSYDAASPYPKFVLYLPIESISDVLKTTQNLPG